MAPSIVSVIANMLSLLFVIAIPLAFLAGAVILQIYLSKKESKWPGLILPAVAFGITFIPFMAFLLYGIVRTTTSVTSHDILVAERVEIQRIEAERYEAYHRITGNEPLVPVRTHYLHAQGTIRASAALVFFWFLVSTVPTAILLIIYAVCRSKRRNLLALNRMSLQDL